MTKMSTAITISGARPTCRGSSAPCSRASSGLTNRSGATIRSANISDDHRRLRASRNRSMCRPTGRRTGFEDEAAWVQRTHEETGWPHGLVAYADLAVKDARPQFERLARYPLVRGVRMQLHWHENPMYRFAARADLRDDEDLRRNVAALADYRLDFRSAGVRSADGKRGEARRGCPESDLRSPARRHAGGPSAGKAAPPGARACRNSPPVPTWFQNSRGSARSFTATTRAHIADVVDATVEMFGAERCLFGSNFPIEKLWTSYGDLVAAYEDAMAAFPAEARDAIFAGTARRVYKLES